MNKLILLDGSNLLHRSLHIPDVYSLFYNGIKTGGVHSFLRSVMMIVRGFQDFPIVLWDKGFSERRIKLYPNYKKREDKDQQEKSGMIEPKDMDYRDEYRKQRAIINKILEPLGIPSLLIPNTEADDIISYLVKTYKDNISCVMSEDLDFLQLLDDTDLFLPMRKKYYTQKPVLEMGLVNYFKLNKVLLTKLEDLEYDSTRHYLVAKAMRGDPSDNIKGAKGIGEVSAKKLALEFIKYSFPNPLGYLEELKQKPILGAYEKKLLKDWDNFLLSLELVDLSREEFSKEKKEDILRQTKLAMTRESTDIISLMGIFGEYGLQQIMIDLPEYLKILMFAKCDVIKLF